jgi:zinc protease
VPDPDAKVVTLWMIVHAGCRDEPDGDCRGLSHYLEHLMFLGRSGDHDPNQMLFFSAGQTNAFTTMLSTSYYQTIPTRPGSADGDLDKLFGLFADRLQKLDPPPAAAARERNVVMREFEFRRADSPRARFNNAVNARMLPGHPFSQPVIGSRADIASYSIDAAKAFHERWYARNNATFVVYGPVSADQVRRAAAAFIAPLAEKPIPSRAWLDARRSFAPLDAKSEMADGEIAHREAQLEKIVRYEEPDLQKGAAARALLFDYLDSEMGGSLSDTLVETRKVFTSISATRTWLGAGALWFTTLGVLDDGVTPEEGQTAIEKYYVDLDAHGLDPRAVDRLKRRRLRDIDDVGESPKRTLAALTNWFSDDGSYDDWLQRRAALEAVTAADIAPLLRAMSGPGRQLFGVLSPAATTAANAAAAPGAAQ